MAEEQSTAYFEMAQDGQGNLVASRADQLAVFGNVFVGVPVSDGTGNSGDEPKTFVLL